MFSITTRLHILLLVVVICFTLYIYNVNAEINKIDKNVKALEKIVKDIVSKTDNTGTCVNDVTGVNGGTCVPKQSPKNKSALTKQPTLVPTEVIDNNDDADSICSNDIKNILTSITCFDTETETENIVIVQEDQPSNTANLEFVDEHAELIERMFHMSGQELDKLKIDKMRIFLRHFHEDTKGTKNVLLERIKKIQASLAPQTSINVEYVTITDVQDEDHAA